MKKYYLLLVSMFIMSCSVVSTNPIGIGTTPHFSELVPQSDYVIYYDNATLPTLYSAVNMMTHSKPSFIYMERKTLDTTKIPANVTVVANDDEMRTKIAELNRNNPNATFTFYVNENRFGRVFNYFYRQGISKGRVRVVQISDGTLTYIIWRDKLSGTDALSVWGKLQNPFNKEINKENSTELVEPEQFANNGMAYPPTSSYSQYEFWMQWPELLVSDSIDLKNYLKENGKRYYKVDPLAYFKSLPVNKQKEFVSLVGLDKKWSSANKEDGTLNNQTIEEALDASPKPNIIITGTNPYSNGDRNMDALIAEVKAFYGGGYDYFFKGHPADLTHPSDKSIVVLPFKLPMEAIIWSYGDKIALMGGIESSLYMNAPKNMKKFFFNEKSDGSTLVSPLNSMYKQGLLGDVKFF